MKLKIANDVAFRYLIDLGIDRYVQALMKKIFASKLYIILKNETLHKISR